MKAFYEQYSATAVTLNGNHHNQHQHLPTDTLNSEPARRRSAGHLDVLSVELLNRFLDEGVPESDVLYVAAETLHCLRDLNAGDELPEQLHPWTWEILTRYNDKADTLFMTTRGTMVRV
jgi:hypothetical protein